MVGGSWALLVPRSAAACGYDLHHPRHTAGAIPVCWCCGLLQQPGECELGVWPGGGCQGLETAQSCPQSSRGSSSSSGPRSPKAPMPSSLRPRSPASSLSEDSRVWTSRLLPGSPSLTALSSRPVQCGQGSRREADLSPILHGAGGSPLRSRLRYCVPDHRH